MMNAAVVIVSMLYAACYRYTAASILYPYAVVHGPKVENG